DRDLEVDRLVLRQRRRRRAGGEQAERQRPDRPDRELPHERCPPNCLRPKHTGFIRRGEMEESRTVALDVLVACLDRGQPLDDALARHPGFPALDPRDRAFVRLLLATTLRRLGEIDTVLNAMIERPLDGANAIGRQILRLGAAQLLFLGTPAHAAVDTAVRLAQDHLPHLKGLTNAVLRRVGREGVALLGDRDPARLNTPEWLWQSWSA